MVATVNPCGFAMVPAYVSILLTDTDADSGGGRSGVRAGLRIGLIVTVAFVATFSVVGAVFRYATTRFLAYIPWAALVIGVALVAVGVAVLAGRHLTVRTFQLRFSRDGSARSMGLFGVAYAVASVSCTLPIFLSVTTVATTAGSFSEGISVFAAYGLGMGSVLVALAVAVATSRDVIVRHMRRVMPYVERIGGWLIVASGLFIVYYWTTLLTVDITSNSPLLTPVRYIDRISAWFTTAIANNMTQTAAGLVTVVAAIAIYETRRTRRSLTNTRQ